MADLLAQSNAFLAELSRPLARTFHLTHLPENFPTLFYSFLGFTVLHSFISPALSARYFPDSYGKLKSRRQINNWNIQVVSLLHVFVVLPLAVRNFWSESLNTDRTYGWDDQIGTTIAVACGYFLWDVIDGLVNFADVGFLIHGVSCFVIYMLVMQPFLAYFACRFLSWELSTIFLNFHRFMDKLDMTGSTAQYINGIFLLGSFFFVRIVYGWYMSFHLACELWAARDNITWLPLLIIFGGNMTLNTLNMIWLTKMVAALRKRFTEDAPASGKANGHTNGKANGKAHVKSE